MNKGINEWITVIANIVITLNGAKTKLRQPETLSTLGL